MDVTGIGAVAGTVGKVVDAADGILERWWPKDASSESKLQAKLAMSKMLSTEYVVEVEAKKEINVAEASQDDNYTKRVRPTVIYSGLAFIFLMNVFMPIMAFLTERPLPQNLTLPPEFWWSWTGMTSVYFFGRSAEKRGMQNKIIGMITGGK